MDHACSLVRDEGVAGSNPATPTSSYDLRAAPSPRQIALRCPAPPSGVGSLHRIAVSRGRVAREFAHTHRVCCRRVYRLAILSTSPSAGASIKTMTKDMPTETPMSRTDSVAVIAGTCSSATTPRRRLADHPTVNSSATPTITAKTARATFMSTVLRPLLPSPLRAGGT
jgi:hypothetical protein